MQNGELSEQNAAHFELDGGQRPLLYSLFR